MAYAQPEYDRTDVNKAGRILLNPPPVLGADTYERALDVINNWRAAHGYPLNAMAMNLRNRARKHDHHAIIAQRLKRLSSIEAKLRRFPTMRLGQIQDIGGCRAVLGRVTDVRRLVDDYFTSDGEEPDTASARRLRRLHLATKRGRVPEHPPDIRVSG